MLDIDLSNFCLGVQGRSEKRGCSKRVFWEYESKHMFLFSSSVYFRSRAIVICAKQNGFDPLDIDFHGFEVCYLGRPIVF